MWKHPVVGFLALLLLAGCAGRPAAAPPAGSQPPVHEAVTPAVTAPGLAPDAAGLQIWGGGPARSVSGPGDHQLVVSTGLVMVHATVHAQSEEAAVQAVKIAGAEPLWPAEARRDGAGDTWAVDVTLDEGKAGDRVAVSMPTMTATLTRKAPPTVTILLQSADGSWAPLASGVSLPPGPKRLRFRTTGLSVDNLTVSYLTSNYEKLTPDKVTRIADDVLEVAFNNPPPMLQALVSSKSNADGLSATPVSGHFYIGEPPALFVADSATGQVERLGQAPPEVSGAAVRKDGPYAALTTLLPEATSGQLVWLVDLKTGALTRTPFQYEDGDRPGFDARGRLVASAGPGRLGIMDPETGKAEIIKTAATFWGPVSPDGRYIAGRVGPPPGRSTGAWIGPPRAYQLVVRDLTTDKERTFPWGGYGGLAWLPDGRLLLSTVSSNSGPDQPTEFFTVNLTTGERMPYKGLWPTPNLHLFKGSFGPGEMPLATVPDGRTLLYRWTNLPNARHGMI